MGPPHPSLFLLGCSEHHWYQITGEVESLCEEKQQAFFQSKVNTWKDHFYEYEWTCSPAAAVISYHRLRGLNNTNLLSYSFGHQQFKMGLLGWNQGVGRAVFLPEARGEDLFLVFPSSRSCHVPWLFGLFLPEIASLQPLLPFSDLLQWLLSFSLVRPLAHQDKLPSHPSLTLSHLQSLFCPVS